MIKKLIRIFSAQAAAEKRTKVDCLHVRQHSSKPNVTSRFVSSDIPKRLRSTDKNWSKMSGWEKVQAGPFLCIVKPDEYDKRWGKYLEFMWFYENEDDYLRDKNYVIQSGRWDEFVHQPTHHRTQ